MRARRAAAWAVVAVLLGAGAGPAGARPACGLVADPSGDARGGTVYDGSSDANLDLVGGEVGTDGRHLVVLARLARHEATDLAAPAGRAYVTEFTVYEGHPRPGAPAVGYGYEVIAYVDATGAVSGEWGSLFIGRYARIGDVAVTVDAARARIRIVAAVSTKNAPLLAGRGNVVNAVRQSTYRLAASMGAVDSGVYWTVAAQFAGVSRPFAGVGRDVADTTRSYVTGAPSCA